MNRLWAAPVRRAAGASRFSYSRSPGSLTAPHTRAKKMVDGQIPKEQTHGS
jgi:hypothetical protein